MWLGIVAFLKAIPPLAYALGLSFVFGMYSCHAWNTRHHLLGTKPDPIPVIVVGQSPEPPPAK